MKFKFEITDDGEIVSVEGLRFGSKEFDLKRPVPLEKYSELQQNIKFLLEYFPVTCEEITEEWGQKEVNGFLDDSIKNQLLFLKILAERGKNDEKVSASMMKEYLEEEGVSVISLRGRTSGITRRTRGLGKRDIFSSYWDYENNETSWKMPKTYRIMIRQYFKTR